MPISGTLDIISLPRSKCDLNFVPISTKFIQCQLTIRNCINNSSNEDLKFIHQETSQGKNFQEQEPCGHPTSTSSVGWIIVNYSYTRVSWPLWLCMTGEERILLPPYSENNVTVEVGQLNFAFLKTIPIPNLVAIA